MDDIINSSIIIYCVKSLQNKIIINQKLLYIFLYSPILLTTGFFYKDIVSYNYWKFLFKLTFPEYKRDMLCNKIINCKIYHEEENECNKALINNCIKTIVISSKVYTKFYILNGLFSILTKNKSFLKVLYNTFYSIIYSTLFLSLQTILIRFLLCNSNCQNKIHVYIISVISSLSILFERDNRVNQINSMITSNLIIGYLKKYNNNYIYKIILLLTLLKDRKVNKANVILSLLSSKL